MLVRKLTTFSAACWMCAGLHLLAAQQTAPAGTKTAKAALPEVSSEQFRKGVEEKLAKSQGKALPKKKNPNVGQKGIRSSLLITLQQQKLAAATSHIKAAGVENVQSAGAQPGAGAGMLAPQHPLLSTPAQPASTNPHTRQAPPDNQTLLKSQQPGAGPSQPMMATGNNNTGSAQAPPVAIAQHGNPKANPKTNSMLVAPRPLTVCFGPGVRAVNGKPNGAIFTPVQDYNTYTITGCLFGTQAGQAYLIGKFHAQQVNLQIQYWSDSEIDARVDPNASGELDQDNVFLIIAPAQAAQIKAAGFKFMAARSDPVLLPNIPSSWATLQTVDAKIMTGLKTFTFTPIHPAYVSPVNRSPAPKSANGASVYVYRSEWGHKFPEGDDVFDFSRLAAGWTTDSMQLFSFDEDNCPWVVTWRQTLGTAFAEWLGDNVRVWWATTSCSGFFPSVVGIPMATYSNSTGSYYALDVWVEGPRCTDPYTGNAQPMCMQNVIRCGSESCGN
jgi:hypothetical protein